MLTFDDGLMCHYQYVYPELKKRGLWGIFYLSTGVYENKKLLDVHRIHVILAARDEKDVFDILSKKINISMLSDRENSLFQSETYKNQVDGDYTKLVKKILNYYIGYEFRERVIDELVDELDLTGLCQVENFYINRKQIFEMSSNGMIIGSHSVNHPVMSKLDVEQQKLEIQSSFSYLDSFINPQFKSFCYPYGGRHSYTEETIQLLSDEKCIFAFDVNSRDIEKDDFVYSRFMLPRYDCNEFPYGQVR